MTEPPVDPPIDPPVDPTEPVPPHDDAGATPPPPAPSPPAVAAPIPVPPPLDAPTLDGSAAPPGEYDTGVLRRTTIWTVVVCAVATWAFAPVALLIPLAMIITLFFIRKKNSPRRRARVAGILLGLGIGLVVSAGVCAAISAGLSSPFFSG